MPSAKPGPADFLDAYHACEGRLREHSRSLIRPEWASIHGISDLLHEVFLRALARWDKHSTGPKCPVEIWLTGQLIDTVRDLNRRYHSGKRGSAVAEVFISRLASVIAGSDTAPPDAAAREEMAERLSLAMANLKPPVRDLLIRIYYNEEPAARIAAALQISAGNLRVRQSRALGKVRESWNELFGEEDPA
jgi:RNA polymerase sigma factor (sigma-70 family)